MSSLKSMMAAKKAQHRITASHAKYSNSGQLSCTLCRLNIKHESLWGAHVQSKAHRVNVQKLEAEQQQAAERASAKRRREDDDEGLDGDADQESGDAAASKRAREDEDGGDSRLPSGFFADPSQAPVASTSSAGGGASIPTGEEQTAAGERQEEDDPEWAEFEKYLASGRGPDQQAGASGTRSTASATIKAAPVKFEFGAPVVHEDGAEGENGDGPEGEDEEEEQETEEDKLEREMREEREEMMARLEEEEREQREADEKVTALKKRLEAIRAARQKK
ncbi:hypothetical protein JCM10908_006970 [Rhodotorula pacifica]|uniref:C2H2-type zinc finger protein n=1 Tax=Rhodotorula pacifica TaxID=1495444 RepID=UPI00317A7F89